MVKRRLIFTLLYSDGHFMLSRNFRLQQVGDVDWLHRNYGFSGIATSIDELIILDVSRCDRDTGRFCEHALAVSRDCFMPLSLGGGIRSLDQARHLVDQGAEKLVVNTLVHEAPERIRELAATYGRQCIVASIDYRATEAGYSVFVENGSTPVAGDLAAAVRAALDAGAGEIYLNSIDRDGTGQGYWMAALEAIGPGVDVPIIMAGGAGNHRHLLEGIRAPRVDAVATANLFNFVGDGLPRARAELLEAGVPLAEW